MSLNWSFYLQTGQQMHYFSQNTFHRWNESPKNVTSRPMCTITGLLLNSTDVVNWTWTCAICKIRSLLLQRQAGTYRTPKLKLATVPQWLCFDQSTNHGYQSVLVWSMLLILSYFWKHSSPCLPLIRPISGNLEFGGKCKPFGALENAIFQTWSRQNSFYWHWTSDCWVLPLLHLASHADKPSTKNFPVSCVEASSTVTAKAKACVCGFNQSPGTPPAFNNRWSVHEEPAIHSIPKTIKNY